MYMLFDEQCATGNDTPSKISHFSNNRPLCTGGVVAGSHAYRHGFVPYKTQEAAQDVRCAGAWLPPDVMGSVY